jgi:structural maintenance of chromosome 1
MDAVSFVLGVKSAQLRSTQLKDLVYRAGALDETDDDTGDAPTTAYVLAVYETDDGDALRFKRT